MYEEVFLKYEKMREYWVIYKEAVSQMHMALHPLTSFLSFLTVQGTFLTHRGGKTKIGKRLDAENSPYG